MCLRNGGDGGRNWPQTRRNRSLLPLTLVAAAAKPVSDSLEYAVTGVRVSAVTAESTVRRTQRTADA